MKIHQTLPLHPPQLPGQGAAVGPQVIRQILPGAPQGEGQAAGAPIFVIQPHGNPLPQGFGGEVQRPLPLGPEFHGNFGHQVFPQLSVPAAALAAAAHNPVEGEKQ